MSGHHRQKAHHLSASNADGTGWVEGITSLKEEHGATQLLHGQGNGAEATTAPVTAAAIKQEKPAVQSPEKKGADEEKNASTGNSSDAAATPAPAPLSITADEEFDACLEHALGVASNQVKSAGEVVLEVGAPNGWGPVGLDEKKLEQVLQQLKETAEKQEADVEVIRRRTTTFPSITTPPGASNIEYHVADVMVRQRAGSRPAMEVRVAIIGNVDSGKSTMVGVLTRSVLDDGRGFARSKVFKHHHEETTGRTSSIGQHNLCLNSKGEILNDNMFRNQTLSEYIAKASKVVTLVDLAGHEKYFRTTAYGLTGHLPDYACLMVGANMGVVGMCKEHLGVALALKVPVFFVITKVDICPEHVLKNTVQNLASILKKPGVKKKPFLVRTMDDVVLCARNINTDSLAPIFLTSAVTGKGLELVRMFYNLMPQRTNWADKAQSHAEFVVDETFSVPGVGTVVAGTVKKGVITPNVNLLLGPDIGDGTFKPVAIKSIHYKRLPVNQVVAGQTAALALKKVKRNQVRKGMVLVDERLKPQACWEFEADIAILTHSTTIQPRYQAVIHCEIIRQAARVVAMDRERLRSGDRASVRFRFLQRPEYITGGTRFVFREGRTKGIGMVVSACEEN